MRSDRISLELNGAYPFNIFRVNSKQTYLHSHDCLEIDLVLKGQGIYLIEDQSYPIEPGDIFVINDSERHMAIHNEQIEMLVMIFNYDFLLQEKEVTTLLKLFHQRKENFSNRIESQNPIYELLVKLFQSIDKEYKNKEELWKLFLRSQVLLFIGHLYRYYNQSNSLEKKANQKIHEYERIRPAIDYIEEHMRDKISLEALASRAMMNRTYFSSYFKKVMHMTPFEYIEQVRIEYSVQLLRNTNKSITDISLESGFNSVSFFNRSFKRQLSLSPREFRKQMQ